MASWNHKTNDSHGDFLGNGIFGMALDVSDDPWTLELKLASAGAEELGVNGLFADPYEAVMSELPVCQNFIEPIGRFFVPTWLRPRPRTSDSHLLNKKNMQMYIDDGKLSELVGQLKTFVQKNVFPRKPIMIGVDHSATGAVVTALSEKLGSRDLGVVVLDQHFDGLPLSHRMEPDFLKQMGLSREDTGLTSSVRVGEKYCCGNFWKHLLDDGIVLPENLLFIGVADYPAKDPAPGWERFRESYLAFESLGCGFFPLEEFKAPYNEKLKTFIEDRLRVPNVYVSLDLDVGAYRCVLAARYMDRAGIDKEALMEVARVISDCRKSGRFELAGLDVMEFNTHFLGIKTEGGDKDMTVSVAVSFIKELLQCEQELKP